MFGLDETSYNCAMEYVIGLDMGTTSCKAVAVAADGRVLGTAASEYGLQTGASGRAVQDAADLWRGVRETFARLGEKIALKEVRGIGLSGAMHSLLPVSASGHPLAPALTWADSRAANEAQALQQSIEVRPLYQRTGCPLEAPYYPARLRWWRDRGLPSNVALFVGLKEWILFRLSGSWRMDRPMASTTGLFDIRRRVWDEEAIALAGIRPSQLPPLVAATAQIGSLTREAAAATGLPAGIPVVAGSHDGGLATIGSGAGQPGDVAVSVGTSGAVRLVSRNPYLDAGMRTWCYLLLGKRWLVGGAINNGGLAVSWVRRQFFRDLVGDETKQMAQFLSEAATIAAGAGGLLFLPYFAGERSPHWDVGDRVTIHGLQLNHSRAHVARAVLEGVAFCLADVWQVLKAGLEGGAERPIRLSGGITRSPLWVQIVADVLGHAVLPVEQADASAIGAAFVTQLGLGWREELDVVLDDGQLGAVVHPLPENQALYRARHEAFQALYRATRS